MSTAGELMANGLPGALANQIGARANTAVTPTGSNQAGAAAITSPHCTLATASSAGVILPTATGAPVYAIFNNSGANQTLYPLGSETLNSTTSFTITSGKTALCFPAVSDWIINLSA